MKTNPPQMFEYMVLSNISMFTCHLSNLKVSENKAGQNFHRVSTQSKARTMK